jgi:NTP pyrophosphatase (non-canonical NTP hydrolase)
MTIDEYGAWAGRIADTRLGSAASTEEKKLAYVVLALTGEIGEVADHVKKVLQGGTWDRNRLASELGDAIYYWSVLCAMTGCVPSEVLERSVATIEARMAAAR